MNHTRTIHEKRFSVTRMNKDRKIEKGIRTVRKKSPWGMYGITRIPTGYLIRLFWNNEKPRKPEFYQEVKIRDFESEDYARLKAKEIRDLQIKSRKDFQIRKEPVNKFKRIDPSKLIVRVCFQKRKRASGNYSYAFRAAYQSGEGILPIHVTIPQDSVGDRYKEMNRLRICILKLQEKEEEFYPTEFCQDLKPYDEEWLELVYRQIKS